MSQAVIGALRVNLGLDSAEFARGAARAQGQARSLSGTLKQQLAVGAVAAAGALALVARRAKTAASEIAAIGDAADRARVDPGVFEELRFAIIAAGQDASGLEGALQRLNRAVVDAGRGSAEATLAFAQIGVDIQGLIARGAQLPQILAAVADGFQRTDNAIAEASASQALFGRSGAAVAVTLEQGSAAYQEQIDRARELGGVLGNDLIREMQATNAELDFQQAIIDQKLNKAFAEATPLVQALQSALAGLVTVLGQAYQGWQALFDRIRDDGSGLSPDLLNAMGMGAAGAVGGALRRPAPAPTVTSRRSGGGGSSVDVFAQALSGARATVADINLENSIFGLTEIEAERARMEIELTTAAMEQYGTVTESVRIAIGEVGDALEREMTIARQYEMEQQQMRDAARDAAYEAREAARQQAEFFDGVASAISGAIVQADSLGDALRRVGLRLAELAIRDVFKGSGSFLARAFGGGGIGSLFSGVLGGALGGVKASSSVTAFADGGIVTNPTLFGFGRGQSGVAGEAGAEAIMPLARDGKGRLGVSAVGGGTSLVQNFDMRGANVSESNMARIAEDAAMRGIARLEARRADDPSVMA